MVAAAAPEMKPASALGGWLSRTVLSLHVPAAPESRRTPPRYLSVHSHSKRARLWRIALRRPPEKGFQQMR